MPYLSHFPFAVQDLLEGLNISVKHGCSLRIYFLKKN